MIIPAAMALSSCSGCSSEPTVAEERNELEEELKGNGRILLRASGTEPVIRVMAEADTKELCAKYVDQMVSVIENQL